ncbi:MAG: hypothetical protein IPL23_27750 [Saprospiraceae bacterium]|nr:hypothetical protein [Saprospiraceae bacterium]
MLRIHNTRGRRNKSIKQINRKAKEEGDKNYKKRNRGVKFEAIIKELNKLIVGYGNYYSLANRWLAGIRDIDGWIRRRLRSYRLKQCKRTIGLVRFLRTLGVKRTTVGTQPIGDQKDGGGKQFTCLYRKQWEKVTLKKMV